MTITQTVEIPSNHWLTIEVPHEIPAGATALVELKVLHSNNKEEKPLADKPSKLRLTKKKLDELLQNAKTPISDSLTGILANQGNGNTDITIEQIREERLAKYLQ